MVSVVVSIALVVWIWYFIVWKIIQEPFISEVILMYASKEDIPATRNLEWRLFRWRDYTLGNTRISSFALIGADSSSVTIRHVFPLSIIFPTLNIPRDVIRETDSEHMWLAKKDYVAVAISGLNTGELHIPRSCIATF